MVNHGTVVTDAHDQRTELTRTLWQWLSSRAILAATGIAIFLLFLCASLIRQMPSQIANDPAAATRWLLTVSEEYGMLGSVLRALGLFDVLHNPLLQLLLAVIALVLLIHLADMLAALWRFWQVPHALAESVTGAGAPLELSHTQPLYRLRQTAPSAPSVLYEQLLRELKSHFTEVITFTSPIAPYQAPMAEASTEAHLETHRPEAQEMLLDAPEHVDEFRLLARRDHQRWIWLRPVLIGGLLLALVAVWITLLAGWEVMSPLLAPGDEYRATTQRVALTYTLLEDHPVVIPALSVEINETPQQLLLGESRRLRFGQIAIQANPGPPALLIRSTDDSAMLSRLGQAQHSANLGLLFPSLGSEDSVVVENSVGLRIVRVAVSPEAVKAGDSASDRNSRIDSPISTAPQEQFLVEVYQSGTGTPVQTLVISQQTSAMIQVSGKRHELLFTPLPSMVVAVRYQPAIWLLWAAFCLILISAVGFRYRPAFLLVQIAPWPTARTVVVAQSDNVVEIERIRLYLK